MAAAAPLQPPPYEQFDCRGGGRSVRWAKWLRRLENNVFAGCNIVNPAQKKGLLLMYAGPDLNDIVDTFDEATLAPVDAVAAQDGNPAVPAQNVYQRLTTAIHNYFNPRANVEFQRYLFKRTMQETDNIEDFYSALKALAETCNFADNNAEIKSQLILGCKLDKVRTKGLSDPNVTLQDLLQYAKTLQASQEQSQAIRSADVNAVRQNPRRHQHQQQQQQQQHQQNRPQQQRQNRPQQCKNNRRASGTPQAAGTTTNKSCTFCGKQWHKSLKDCPAQGKTCRKCGKQNHFARACLSGKVQQITQDIAEIIVDSITQSNNYVYAAKQEDFHKSPYFNIAIGNSQVSMMADSGADVNLLTDTDYKKLLNPPSLQTSAAKIFAYGEQKPLPLAGEFVTDLCYNNVTCKAKIIVVHNGPRSILGWETSRKLRLLTTVNSTNTNVDNIVAQHST